MQYKILEKIIPFLSHSSKSFLYSHYSPKMPWALWSPTFVLYLFFTLAVILRHNMRPLKESIRWTLSF